MVILADLAHPEKGLARVLDFAHKNHDERRKKLMETVDRVNRLKGGGTIRFASQGAGQGDEKGAPVADVDDMPAGTAEGVGRGRGIWA